MNKDNIKTNTKKKLNLNLLARQFNLKNSLEKKFSIVFLKFQSLHFFNFVEEH